MGEAAEAPCCFFGAAFFAALAGGCLVLGYGAEGVVSC